MDGNRISPFPYMNTSIVSPHFPINISFCRLSFINALSRYTIECVFYRFPNLKLFSNFLKKQ